MGEARGCSNAQLSRGRGAEHSKGAGRGGAAAELGTSTERATGQGAALSSTHHQGIDRSALCIQNVREYAASERPRVLLPLPLHLHHLGGRRVAQERDCHSSLQTLLLLGIPTGDKQVSQAGRQ